MLSAFVPPRLNLFTEVVDYYLMKLSLKLPGTYVGGFRVKREGKEIKFLA